LPPAPSIASRLATCPCGYDPFLRLWHEKEFEQKHAEHAKEDFVSPAAPFLLGLNLIAIIAGAAY
jgi:hypothetical protein